MKQAVRSPRAAGSVLPGALVISMALCVGCAGIRQDMSAVSDGVEQRSGHSVTNGRPGEVAWPSTVSIEDGLSEDELVTLALWNNAAFQETLADLGVSRADLVQAGMLPNPTLSMLIPVGAKPIELTARYPLEILWLRPGRVAVARLDYERTAQRLIQGGLDLIRDTRVAFADFVLASQRLVLADSAVTLIQGIATQMEARWRAGEASELETSQAQVDVTQAREQLARARHENDVARERLRNLAGLVFLPWPAVQESALPPRFAGETGLLLTNALHSRPDLRAAEIGLEAAGKRLGLGRAETFTFAAGINAKDIGSGPNKEFLVGPALDFAVPVLNLNQGGVARAKALFEKATRQYYTARNRIALEVREAHARLAQAQESHEQWQQRILPPLEETVRQSEKAYAGGNVTFLFVLENSRRLLDARTRAVTTSADVRRARAELERAVGQRLETHD